MGIPELLGREFGAPHDILGISPVVVHNPLDLPDMVPCKNYAGMVAVLDCDSDPSRWRTLKAVRIVPLFRFRYEIRGFFDANFHPRPLRALPLLNSLFYVYCNVNVRNSLYTDSLIVGMVMVYLENFTK